MKNKLDHKDIEHSLRNKQEEPERDRSREVLDHLRDYGVAAGTAAIAPAALLSRIKDNTPIQTVK